MNHKFSKLVALLCLVSVVAACSPRTFSPPTQLHITPGDHIGQAVIGMDAAGRSHIAGIVNSNVVYYRTTFGTPEIALTMTMGGSGKSFRQTNPDIAVTDDGTAWLVWIEQQGGPEKFGCYREIPLVPPDGGYVTTCNRLSPTTTTMGNVMVVARGNTAYALFDTYAPTGGMGSLSYKKLTSPASSGIIYSYLEPMVMRMLFQWDAGIDRDGFLHVAFSDQIDTNPPVRKLQYRSDRTKQLDGKMTQAWELTSSNGLRLDVPPRLAFYLQGGVERVLVGSVAKTAGIDKIWMNHCESNGCATKDTQLVFLPSEFTIYADIVDIEFLGIEDQLHMAFIGASTLSFANNVFYKSNAFDAFSLTMVSADPNIHAFDLEGAVVGPRPGNAFLATTPVITWAEMDLSSLIKFYNYDRYDARTTVFESDCLTSDHGGEPASNGYHYAGVWQVCSDTWFAAQAYLTQLPLVLR